LVVSGDILREEAKKDTERGWKIAEVMAHQQIVDPTLFFEIIHERIAQCRSEFVLLDGCPRSIAQLDAQIAKFGKPTAVVFLEVADDVLVKRLQGRAKTSGRADDNDAAIINRIAVNKKDCAPVIEKIEEEGIPLEKVDGAGDVDDVRARFIAALKKYWDFQV
jgi:adenylate kinase